MLGSTGLGKLLIYFGVALIAMGVLVMLLGRISFFKLGRLPGDLYFQRGHFQFYFPIVTCLVLSLILTVLFALFRR